MDDELNPNKQGIDGVGRRGCLNGCKRAIDARVADRYGTNAVGNGSNVDNGDGNGGHDVAGAGATEQAVNAFNILNEQTSKGAADQVVDYLGVREEESLEGDPKKMANSYSLSVYEESSEVASKQGDSTHEVAFEAGEAFSSGVTPDPVLNSPVAQAGEAFSSGVTPDPVLNSPVAQDGSKTQAIDIDKDESHHTKCNKGSSIPVDDEDDDQPGRDTVHPPGAMNGGNLCMEPESALSAALRAEFYWESVYHRESYAVHAIENGMLHHTYLWHYADPRGNTQGPFLLAQLWEWKEDGYFDTKEFAILLTEAYERFY